MQRRITTIFSDLGGVLLSNAWDHLQRKEVIDRLGLDWQEFEHRHAPLVESLETGRLDLSRYLDLCVFYEPRAFSKVEFQDLMYSQSIAYTDNLVMISNLASCHQFLMCTLNNESLELNNHRIEKFELTKYFTAFFSSSFVGIRKPSPEIYKLALNVMQRQPSECLFIDDREENIDTAAALGMNSVLIKDAQQLAKALSMWLPN